MRCGRRWKCVFYFDANYITLIAIGHTYQVCGIKGHTVMENLGSRAHRGDRYVYVHPITLAREMLKKKVDDELR